MMKLNKSLKTILMINKKKKWKINRTKSNILRKILQKKKKFIMLLNSYQKRKHHKRLVINSQILVILIWNIN
jgi:hypothetical protein